MLLNDGLEPPDEGVERVVGILFLGPECRADLLFRERM